MDDKERREIGLKKLADVYAGDVTPPPAGNVFVDTMLKQLFAEVWTREVLSMRDKRLLLLGIIAEKGEAMTFKIQAKASLKRGETNPEELRETLLMIAQYSGYPRAASMMLVLEEAIAEYQQEEAK